MKNITLAIAGDFCPQGKVAENIVAGTYNIDPILTKCFRDADISIVNLEAPILSKRKVSPIVKHGPNLTVPPETLAFLDKIGCKVVTLANNHILDYGSEGLFDTLDFLNKSSLKYVGVGLSLESARKPTLVNVSGKTIAFINCCEHEYSIASEYTPGANPINPIQQYYDIKEAKSQADYVIVIVHGGIENYQLPSPRMKKTYRFFIDAGADVVVNHHQHCYSGYETYKGKPIFYGIGNFCFDWPNMLPTWYEGFIPIISLGDVLTFDIIPYKQCEDGTIRHMDREEQINFTNKIQELNSIIQNDKILNDKHCMFMDSTMSNYEFILSPYSISYTIKLFKKNLLPSFYRNRKWIWLQSAIQCESHYERFLYMVNKKVFHKNGNNGF